MTEPSGRWRERVLQAQTEEFVRGDDDEASYFGDDGSRCVRGSSLRTKRLAARLGPLHFNDLSIPTENSDDVVCGVTYLAFPEEATLVLGENHFKDRIGGSAGC
jgi:hypothetical protein